MSDDQLRDLDMAAAAGDFGSCGDEIQQVTAELRASRERIAQLQRALDQYGDWSRYQEQIRRALSQ